jgi:hypothetical protein
MSASTPPEKDYAKIPTPTDRLTAWRRDHPQEQVQKRWPKVYQPTPAEQATLDAIADPVTRLSLYRSMGDKAQQPPAAGGDEAG